MVRERVQRTGPAGAWPGGRALEEGGSARPGVWRGTRLACWRSRGRSQPAPKVSEPRGHQQRFLLWSGLGRLCVGGGRKDPPHGSGQAGCPKTDLCRWRARETQMPEVPGQNVGRSSWEITRADGRPALLQPTAASPGGTCGLSHGGEGPQQNPSQLSSGPLRPVPADI